MAVKAKQGIRGEEQYRQKSQEGGGIFVVSGSY